MVIRWFLFTWYVYPEWSVHCRSLHCRNLLPMKTHRCGHFPSFLFGLIGRSVYGGRQMYSNILPERQIWVNWSKNRKKRQSIWFLCVSPQTQQLLQYSGDRTRPCDSFLIAALSVGVVNLGCSPTRHCSGPCFQVQTEILFLPQTNRSGIFS